MDTDTNIGKKIQSARKEAGLTQEQAAELIGVSRQSISNWETENSYPSIISVIKMSDAYHVSLDYLLKGEPAMNKYYEYLKESTDVVESNTRKGRLLTVLIYLIIWAVAMIFFWFFTSGSDAMGYSLMFLWIILPVTTFVISRVIGIKDYWGRKKWLASPVLGIMYMLAEYGTYSMSNNMAFHKINAPEWRMIIAGSVISLIALVLGHLIGKRKQKHIS